MNKRIKKKIKKIQDTRNDFFNKFLYKVIKDYRRKHLDLL